MVSYMTFGLSRLKLVDNNSGSPISPIYKAEPKNKLKNQRVNIANCKARSIDRDFTLKKHKFTVIVMDMLTNMPPLFDMKLKLIWALYGGYFSKSGF